MSTRWVDGKRTSGKAAYAGLGLAIGTTLGIAWGILLGFGLSNNATAAGGLMLGFCGGWAVDRVVEVLYE